jgi:hypothetical protein
MKIPLPAREAELSNETLHRFIRGMDGVRTDNNVIFKHVFVEDADGDEHVQLHARKEHDSFPGPDVFTEADVIVVLADLFIHSWFEVTLAGEFEPFTAQITHEPRGHLRNETGGVTVFDLAKGLLELAERRKDR